MASENEHLLMCLAEECDEVGQRVMKALRFGLAEVQPGQDLTNAERIVEELSDLLAVAIILDRQRIIAIREVTDEVVAAKEARIRKFMAISRREGAL